MEWIAVTGLSHWVAIDQTGGRGNYWQRNFIIREMDQDDQDDQDGGENFH